MVWRRSTKSVAIFFIYVLLVAYRANGGLTLYINRRIAEEMGLSVTNDIFLIRNGTSNRVFENEALFSEVFKSLSSSVQRVQMNMFATKHPVRYSLSVTSSNVEIMPQPRILSIKSQGTVKQERTFQISLPCSGYTDGSVNVKFVLNYTNYKGNKLDRSSTRTLEFTVAKQCGEVLKTTQTTPKKAKKNLDRTIVIAVCAVLACLVCLLVGVVFFWCFVKRMRNKFGFDQATERLTPLSQIPRQSIASTSDCQVATTIVYSSKGKRLRNSFFTKIAKRQESKRVRESSATNSDSSHLITSPASGPLSVNSTSTTKEQFASRDLFSQGEDDVFACEQSDEVALIQNSPSNVTLAKEWESKNDMYSTLNEYWASQLRDNLCSRQQVEIRSAEVIGEGAFGRVLRGKLLLECQQQTGEATHGQIQRVDVAVKVCQQDIEFEQMVSFVNEAILMTVLTHVNLLNLLGVVLQPSCPPLILTPFLSHGDLHTFLRHSRGIGSRRQLIGSRQLVNFAAQIALGMEYLSSKKVVHRDLAARNCFVDEDLNVKIGDFGLARNIDQFALHKMEHTTQLPVKWLALESLLYYIFTEKSDIWSFGIVLWELVTLGSQPYAGLDNDEVTPYLETGKRLSRPLRCPDDLYAMMYSCWLASPDERPTFSILVHKLEDYEVRLRHSCIAFEFDEDTIEMNDDCEHV